MEAGNPAWDGLFKGLLYLDFFTVPCRFKRESYPILLFLFT